MKVNWQQFLPLVALSVTTIVAILGWIIVHSLSGKRDQANKRRDIRLQYLIEAYRRLGDATTRDLTSASEQAQGLESAIADIQLFGSISQVEKLKKFLEHYASNGNANVDDVINDLRDELQKELDLPPVSGNIQWMRVKTTTKTMRR